MESHTSTDGAGPQTAAAPAPPPSSHDSIPVAPSLEPALASVYAPQDVRPVDERVAFICLVSVAVAVAAGILADALMRLIALITNLAFFGRVAVDAVAPGPA